MRTSRARFRGAIAGIGTTSGVRVVVGRWDESPYGPFADAMVETAAGHRVLLAPTAEVADLVATTYSFDEVRVEPVAVDGWDLSSPSLSLGIVVGGRTGLGRLVRAVPGPIAESPLWCTVTDPVARVALRGVRTRGSAGQGRREWYGATDVHAVERVEGTFDGAGLGALAPVLPAPAFGFSSTPSRPCVTALVTTISPAPRAAPSRRPGEATPTTARRAGRRRPDGS